MPARTRATTAAADRVYSSTPFQRQITFRPRKQKIRSRASLQDIKRSRQQTLTQIDFVNLHGQDDEAENGIYDQETQRKTKRWKTEGDAPTSTAKQYTQTLTQLEFVSIPASTFDSGDEVLANISCPSLQSLNKQRISEERNDQMTEARLLATSMGYPTTPSRRRVVEIPSSQSPVTPLSTQSRRTLGYRSPLKSVPINIQGALKGSESPVLIRSPLKRSPLEVEGGFDSDSTQSQQLCWQSQRKILSSTNGVASTPGWQAGNCIMTSDTDESAARRPDFSNGMEIEDSDAESDEEPNTYYDDLEPETKIEVDEIISSSEDRQPEWLSGSQEKARINLPALSQFSQTQRLSTQHFDLMAPRSDKSDIIISIHPQHVANIVSGVKDHEFRTWPIPDQVKRVWIYETKPTSAIKYMASIAAAKMPGEIVNESGVGNADFNAGRKMSAYAYEILQLYELADPVSLETAKRNHWLGGPPQKYVYVRPAVLDHLMANLRMPMFSQPSIEPPSPTETDSHEAEAQLRSTMLQYSQMPSKERTTPSYNTSPTKRFHQASDVRSREQESYCGAFRSSIPRHSQATTVDLTQPVHSYAALPDTRQRAEILHGSGPDDDSVVLNSPIRHALPSLKSSPSSLAVLQSPDCGETPIPYFLPSSQLMTKSQMPESLLHDSMPLPPILVDDSDLDE